MEKKFRFEELNVYQDGLLFVDSIYNLTQAFPNDEMFGLVNQLRRAAVSISLNIAEGSGRTKKDFRHFLDMARSSCQECIPLLEIAKRRKLAAENEFNKFYENFSVIARQISALKRSILP